MSRTTDYVIDEMNKEYQKEMEMAITKDMENAGWYWNKNEGKFVKKMKEEAI